MSPSTAARRNSSRLRSSASRRSFCAWASCSSASRARSGSRSFSACRNSASRCFSSGLERPIQLVLDLRHPRLPLRIVDPRRLGRLLQLFERLLQRFRLADQLVLTLGHRLGRVAPLRTRAWRLHPGAGPAGCPGAAVPGRDPRYDAPAAGSPLATESIRPAMSREASRAAARGCRKASGSRRRYSRDRPSCPGGELSRASTNTGGCLPAGGRDG